MATKKEIISELEELVDKMEEQWGELEGFEVILSKDKNEEGKVNFKNIKELNIYYFTKENVI